MGYLFETRDSNAINKDSFDEQVTVITAEGNISDIEAFRDNYNNYLTGFRMQNLNLLILSDKTID